MDLVPLLDLSVAGTLRSGVQSRHWPKGDFAAQFDKIGQNGRGAAGFTASGFKLVGAAGIADLLERSDARYAVEVRCPQTAWAKTYTAATGSSTVSCDIPAGITRGRLWLWPGVVTVADAQMPTGDLHPLLRTARNGETRRSVQVPAGVWLVIGRPHKANLDRGGDSMVVFDFEEGIKRGEATIRKVNDGGDARFHITLSTKQRERADRDETLHWAAQAVALAMLPYQHEYDITNDHNEDPHVTGSRLGNELARRLTNADIPLWNNKTDWDPLRALTRVLMALPDMPDTGT